MQYEYMQKPLPTDAKGVSVIITAIDPNGNFQDLGTAVTDTNGNYGIMWTPPVPGLYQIKATFEGTESYGGSTATTYIGVDAQKANPVVSPTPPPTVAPTSPLTLAPTSPPLTVAPASPSPSIAPPPTSIVPTTTYVSIGAVVIIVVAAAAALILRRRK
jgi:hypothetical protein